MRTSIYIGVLTLFTVFYVQNGYSQDPNIEWENTIGGASDDAAFSISKANDGGFLLSGWSNSPASGDKSDSGNGQYDYWIVKIDSQGMVEWDNAIGGSEWDILETCNPTPDGGFVLGGFSYSDASGDKSEDGWGQDDYWVVKVDEFGEIEWENTIGGTLGDVMKTVIPTVDGGFFVGGSSESGPSGDKTESRVGQFDYWVLKLDANGEIEWQNTIGGLQSEDLEFTLQTSDEGYLIGGSSNSVVSGDKTEPAQGGMDYWIVKLDNSGEIEWDAVVGGGDNDFLKDAIVLDDGSYVLVGASSSNASGDKTENSQGSYDYWIVKLDATGNVLWDRTIGGADFDSFSSAEKVITQTSDGGFIIGGSSRSNISGDKTENGIGGDDNWIVKLHPVGVIQWQNTIGGTGDDEFGSIIQADDEGFVVISGSDSNASGDKGENAMGNSDYWVIKHSFLELGITEKETLENFEVYPNPTTNEVYVNYLGAPLDEIIIYSSEGKIIQTYSDLHMNQSISLMGLASGVYFIQGIIGDVIATKKVVKI